MTITAHPDDETVCLVTEESEIVPALRLQNPTTRAVFYRRPALTELFIAAGAIAARRDENVLFRKGDYFRNPFDERYVYSRHLDLQGSWRQVLNKATECAIDIEPETAKVIFKDIQTVHTLHQRIFREYTNSVSAARLDFNIVTKGATGCTPQMHVDITKLNAHVSYLTPLQWLAGVPAIQEWEHIVHETLGVSGIALQGRLKETEIGGVVFIKGLALYSDDRKTQLARLGTLPHRSSSKIPECGQISIANF